MYPGCRTTRDDVHGTSRNEREARTTIVGNAIERQEEGSSGRGEWPGLGGKSSD